MGKHPQGLPGGVLWKGRVHPGGANFMHKLRLSLWFSPPPFSLGSDFWVCVLFGGVIKTELLMQAATSVS